MNKIETVNHLEAGTSVLFGGDKRVRIDAGLAARFQPGDSLEIAPKTGELLYIPAREKAIARGAVSRALKAFESMRSVSDRAIEGFFGAFAEGLADDRVWDRVVEVNRADVADAKARGRSTVRLEANEKMRLGMIEGLRGWIEAPSRRGQILETVKHEGFRVELIGAALGVVAFIFEGRPNVLADACGVIRGGNTVVFRIGRDALKTAKAIMDLALNPALEKAGLPSGAATLVESSSHASGWAMFCDGRLSLAVARGSGHAVETLGSLARQAGVATSLHGTGGAWIIASEKADAQTFGEAVYRSLDRKVCNTLNTVCLTRAVAGELFPVLCKNLQKAADRRGHPWKMHLSRHDRGLVEPEDLGRVVGIARAEGIVQEHQIELIDLEDIGKEWEWEGSPEIALTLVDSVDEAVSLCNRYSPQFVGSLISEDATEQKHFYESLNAPFVGDSFTRWVDGQYALRKPELGLSNWQNGRLFGRGSILSGDSVFTVRTRYIRE